MAIFLYIYSNLIQFNVIEILYYFTKCILPLEKKSAGTLNYYSPSQKGTVDNQYNLEKPISFLKTFTIFRMKRPEQISYSHFTGVNFKGPLKIN